MYKPLWAIPLCLPALAATYRLDLQESTLRLKPGLVTKVWAYNGQVPGPVIRATPGERIVIEGTNRLPVPTNIHWHGIAVPNDMDGPAITTAPGTSFRYEFVVPESGTYWYHSHFRPVLDQVDRGLYGLFIVSAPEDKAYSNDTALVLDDWYLDAKGNRLPGAAPGDMERLGNVETVNSRTGSAIPPLVWRKGELNKLRFLNASTAAVHTLKITGHRFRVTHLDGHPLSAPYETDTLTLRPAERIDVEVAATGEPGKRYAITSSRPKLGMVIPIQYALATVQQVASPFKPPALRSFPGIEQAPPDFTLNLDSVMQDGTAMPGQGPGDTTMQGHAGMPMPAQGAVPTHDQGGTATQDQGGTPAPGQGHGGMAMPMAGATRWTINGKSYPDTESLDVPLHKVIKVRLVNRDTKGMHPMDHPMHVHGTYFQVVSINGKAPESPIWKDTINVPAGQYVDIAMAFDKPGDWMFHCHIIDHEDGGMMTMVRVR